MPGRLTVRRVLALVAVLLWPLRAGAQPQPGAPATWQVEALVGFTRVAPDDLHARVAYDTAWLDYLRTAQITQQHAGGLEELGDATPFAVRVTKRVGRHWLVGGGFSYFSSEASSSASASYRYTVVDPKAQEYQREFAQSLEVDPLVLEVRDYFPHGLVGYDVGLGSRLRLGGTLSAGWVIADCTLTRSSAALGGFYVTSTRTDLEMSGQGGGVAADALLMARLSVTSRVGVLVEGGYSWHEIKNVTGTRESAQRIQDGEATEVEREVVGRAEGRWINQAVTVQTASGTWRGTVPSIGVDGPPFTLSLSGWQIRAGVSFGF
ncbi:MAG: hypothetical protein MUE61_21760 [Vicinamibacterales bacterium]|jgi:hypothetical protein|nr:hypothetical protein [Vicinamibacterales bacterium]